ncbi:hypothetical protein BJX64DRAFT_205298 [Aspergillus heterothallicus]
MSENSSRKPHTSSPKTNNGPYKRGYIACVRCRSRKVRCVLDSEPPCAKCRREHRQCVFRTERMSHRRRQPPSWAKEHLEVQDSPRPIPDDPTLPVDCSPGRSFIERAMINIAPQPRPFQSPLNLLNGEGVSDTYHTPVEASTTMIPNITGEDAKNKLPHPSEPAIISHPLPGTVVWLSKVEKETLCVWNTYNLVRQRWFTAQEAITYLDLFFEHVSPLSPVLVSEYKEHAAHRRLIVEEPVLCCTILMIASRYFILPGPGGQVRSHFIHQRLWQRCAHLLEQVKFGKGADLSTPDSVLGIIESCLLISDWHPRSASFPAEQDELESDISPKDDSGKNEHAKIDILHWSKDVIEPSKTSDHMSWMLLGTATSLAYKVGLFSHDHMSTTAGTQSRCIRTGKLLYVYVTNLSVRLNCGSPLPQAYPLAVLSSEAGTPLETKWDHFIKAWLDLVKLIRTASAMFFESTHQTRRLLSSGQYVIFLQHFAPSLTRWRGDLEACSLKLPSTLRDLLLIEYNNLRIYTHALAMQAVVERAIRQGIHELEHRHIELKATCFTTPDYEFVEEVVNGSCEILRLTTDMAASGSLRYIPVRQSLCIISAAIFLIKAMSIGSWHFEVRGALETLDRCMAALRESPIDDMDFSSRFANLIEKRITAFQQSIMPSREIAQQSGLQSASNSSVADSSLSISMEAGQAEKGHLLTLCEGPWGPSFDPSVAPFSASGNYISSLERDSLDFLWNLPDI